MKKIGIIFSIVFIFLIYHSWFFALLTSSGDSGFYYPAVFGERIHFLSAWMPERGSGMGGVYYPLLWSAFDVALPLFLFGNIVHSWSLIEKFAYYYPFLIIGFFSSFFLFKKLFPKNIFAFLSPIIFLTNTYILMIAGGGQLLIALSYAMMPIILWQVIDLMCTIFSHDKNKKKILLFSLLLGLSVSIQVLFDLRIVYVTFIAILLYIIFVLFQQKQKTLRILPSILLYIFLLPIIIVGLLHAFWILPALLLHQNPIQQLHIVSTSQTVQFFSFAKFENTIALLHPNWPENIFGKVTFMQPEFLMLPLIAFSSLLFIAKKKNEEKILILFFVALGLLGSFLAKGSQDPFGSLYIWFFSVIPGFNLFRDPTKWYVLIALSYSMLLPYTIAEIYSWIRGDRT